MKSQVIAGLVAVLVVPTMASPARKAAARGYIVFSGTNCEHVAATDLDVHITGTPLPKIVWTLVTRSCTANPKPKVTVGIFASGGQYYSDFLDCTATELNLGNRVECTIKCKPDGGEGKFAYAVCVGGEVIFDPELRLKGVPIEALGACTTTSDKAAVRQACMAASQ